MADPLARQERTVSRLEEALEQRARRLGMSVKQLLAEDRAALRRSDYPTPECLNPFEVEQFFSTNLRDDRVSHVEECPMCAALLDAARPTEDMLAQFIDEYRLAKDAHSVAGTAKSSVRRPLTEVLWVEVPMVFAVLAVTVVGISMVRDTIITNLLSTIALRSVAYVFIVALLIAALTVVAARCLKFGRGATFQRFGGMVTGGTFIIVLVVYGTQLSLKVHSTYSGLETAQNALLVTLAEQRGSGGLTEILANVNAVYKLTASPDGNQLSATSTKFDGKLVAQQKRNSIDVYWDLGRRRNLGTIYEGTLEHGAKGEVSVLVGADKVAVGSGLMDQALGSGTRVLALVPTNGSEASKIFPVHPEAKNAVAPEASPE